MTERLNPWENQTGLFDAVIGSLVPSAPLFPAGSHFSDRWGGYDFALTIGSSGSQG
jgi:hypothetical protein